MSEEKFNSPEKEGSSHQVILKEERDLADYQVIFFNDDQTTMDFVVEVLMDIFHKSFTRSHELMLKIHQQGSAIVGVYKKEIAETKAHQVLQLAKLKGFPLKVTFEKKLN